MSRERVALLSVRIALGVFFIFEGWDKLPWMTNPGLLKIALAEVGGRGCSGQQVVYRNNSDPGSIGLRKTGIPGRSRGRSGVAFRSLAAAGGNSRISYGAEYPFRTQQYFSVWIFVEG